MIDYDELAGLFFEAKSLTDEDRLRFMETHDGDGPTSMNEAHTFRSHLGALITASNGQFSLDPKYRGLGRVAILIEGVADTVLVVQSHSSLELRATLTEDPDLIDVNDGTFFLLIFQFTEEALNFEIAPAQVSESEDDRKYRLLAPPRSLGAWPLDGSQRDDFGHFHQGDEYESWFEEDEGDADADGGAA